MIHDLNPYYQKIQEGDEKAFEVVYKEVYSPLCNYSCQLTGDYSLSQEVVQDVMLKIWQNRAYTKIRGSFKAYLIKSVHNHSLNAIRNQKARKSSMNMPGPEEIWRFITNIYEINDYIIERIFSEETEILIHKAIEKLPKQCSRIFTMSRFESLSNEEIAEKLDLSVNTVRTQIYLALQKIDQYLKEIC